MTAILDCEEETRSDFEFKNSEDPISVFENGVFRRSHVGNNPVNLFDPLGLDPIDPRTGNVNSVLICHVNPHNDPYENAIGGAALVGVAGAAALGPRIAATTSSVIAAGQRFLYRYGDKLVPWLEFAKGQLEDLIQGKPGPEDYIGPVWDKYKDATRNNQCKPDYKKTYECHRGY